MIEKIVSEDDDMIKNNTLNIFLNPYSYLLLRKRREILKYCDKIMIDGQFLVNIINLFLGKKMKRKSFDMTSLAPIVFEKASRDKDCVYLIGSEKNSINKAVERFKKRFPELDICGYRDGYFQSIIERKETIDNIVLLNPSIVIVGMGTPLQEKFLVDLKEAGWSGSGYTCGGFFHQTAKKITYYPKWANKLHLRWVYRIIDEPKLFRRYTIDYSKFLFVFIYDVIKYKRAKNFMN